MGAKNVVLEHLATDALASDIPDLQRHLRVS